jgi:signal peptidase I
MSDVPARPPSPVPPRRRSVIGAILAWARDLAFSVVIAFVVIIFIYQPVKVEGNSMLPGLVDQERIFVNKFGYRFGIGSIERGDLIVFWYPGDLSKSFIKRVIALPGDTIEIDRGTVILNGRPLREDYVPAEYRDSISMPPRKVDPGKYFVLGDHRNSSNDSRAGWLAPRSSIYGKAVFVYWPLARLGPLK